MKSKTKRDIQTVSKLHQEDIFYIRKTISLARKAEGCTSPNPLVGAVLVKKGKVLSTGYHSRAGSAHAEIEAIKKSKINLKGATLYVNLEPCCHFGKTPPCVDEIIKRGIRRVVVSTVDPNPVVCGKSLKKLKRSGVLVTNNILIPEAQSLNEVFFTNMRVQRPYVVAKVAQSLDGKIATYKGVSKWITGPSSRRYARSLRDKYDCILVGVTTVINDNPHLNGLKKIPYKVVIDPDLQIPLDSYLVKNHPGKLILFTSLESKHKKKNKALSHVKRIYMKKSNGGFSIKEIVKTLYKAGITSIFVEGGSYTLGRFLREKLIDKAHIFIAPRIVGGQAALSSFGAQGYPDIDHAPRLKNIHVRHIENDMLITGYVDFTNTNFF